jgi:hypothetical protein
MCQGPLRLLPCRIARSKGVLEYQIKTKIGTSIGQTDDFSYNILQVPVHVHVHDLNAKIVQLLGIDH